MGNLQNGESKPMIRRRKSAEEEMNNAKTKREIPEPTKIQKKKDLFDTIRREWEK